jgi:hypothetical protein
LLGVLRLSYADPHMKDLPLVPERPTSWQTFQRAHGGAIAGADFFTTEVWTWRGLVTFYTVFVIDLGSRRVPIVGSTPYPNEPFMQQSCGRWLQRRTGCSSSITADL